LFKYYGRVSTDKTGRLSGRKAQAARNDQVILEAARSVFLADPDAPISAVAKRAEVGIGALYTRYGSKEELLRKLCTDGLALFVAETEAALADTRDHWSVFTSFMERLVAADTSSITLALAGTFTPTPDMFELAERSNRLLQEFFDRIRDALRPGLSVHDISLVFELVAAVKLPSAERTARLRQRYLAIILSGMRQSAAGEDLPGPPPSWQEINERWRT
jgi:AcrR family transcriptional regulator